ncbi:dual specificity protein phosphatase 10-like [Lineus longissimus]|uniref:dual specificity protein phosphatase 10-like n=1 Tax=Lineus longissimus TaxID=88925 RepID=UPI002B4CF450
MPIVALVNEVLFKGVLFVKQFLGLTLEVLSMPGALMLDRLPVGLEVKRAQFKLDFPVVGRPTLDTLASPCRPVAMPITLSSPPTKRLRIDNGPVGLPPKLCLFNTAPPRQVKAIHPSDLANKMNRAKGPILLDCRSFLNFNQNHIQGALNVTCTDRYNKKRLQQGKITLVDLISSKDGKDCYRKKHMLRDIIVYDEGTSDLSLVTPTEPMQLIVQSLLRDGKEVTFLKGGISDFKKQYHSLCENALKSHPHCPLTPLQSPTSSANEPDIETANASAVLKFLYLGNERDAANHQLLKDFRITYVLNVTSHIPCYFENQGIKYKRLPATDCGQQNLRQYFEEAFRFIEEAYKNDGNVLIHCQAGVSRSATMTIAYIMKHTHLSMIDCYKYVKARRPIISPNFNFMGQLLEFEQCLNSGKIQRTIEPILQGSEANC